MSFQFNPCAVPPNPCLRAGRIYTKTLPTFRQIIGRLPSLLSGLLQEWIRSKYRKSFVGRLKFLCLYPAFGLNSSAVFNLFPPLFICVNQPFTFNHAATDPTAIL